MLQYGLPCNWIQEVPYMSNTSVSIESVESLLPKEFLELFQPFQVDQIKSMISSFLVMNFSVHKYVFEYCPKRSVHHPARSKLIRPTAENRCIAANIAISVLSLIMVNWLITLINLSRNGINWLMIHLDNFYIQWYTCCRHMSLIAIKYKRCHLYLLLFKLLFLDKPQPCHYPERDELAFV